MDQELINVLEKIAMSMDNIDRLLDIYVKDDMRFKEGIKNNIVSIDNEMLSIRCALQNIATREGSF